MKNKDIDASKYIDKFIKHAIDKLIYNLNEKYDIELSKSSQLEILNLSINYIQRMNQAIIAEQLVEPDDYDSASSRFLY